ncbi:MAG: hypothetical protein UR66_C0010G0022 [Candidatus Moranbacteria bacterium GW2011_GWE1_35_17]|nr:MAG: hypothetical protein UR66_C0010G0022 [Candidatus Moranbacteria bacterium GW2011_GWE1_35_17]KKP67841.1 MAG: hypothetical protein UR65_C0065G0007 [Candidatus Moranbacteria bacterium GW2011_GWE2_35_164]KKP83682.1 MAG: hypothetical protein UR82_C0019G0010 [Candidatus Moranbacteria bacterium GW2011_GWF1_35_5]KKP83919.1 MAG: hypothetical protein UR83_C0030G0003 [Candidatus Moranbacteria bacterium GW2011_GWF2_35_54]
MNKVEICKKLERTAVKIALFSGDQLQGTGTGVIIKNNGVVLTANHVISDFCKIANPKIIIITKDKNDKVLHLEYLPVLYNVSFDANMPESFNSLNIDLAILKPKEVVDFGDDYISLEDNLMPVGEDIIMAGFPDEIRLPLDVDSKFNFDNPEMLEKRKEIGQALDFFMALRMAKSGMVGATHKIIINGNFNSKSINVEGASYWIDNASTFGASGGPVVNYEGRLVGIICQKALTKLPPYSEINIPSGSTMALSHKLITWGMYLCDL